MLHALYGRGSSGVIRLDSRRTLILAARNGGETMYLQVVHKENKDETQEMVYGNTYAS